MVERKIPVNLSVRRGTQGYFGQRLIEDALRQDLDVDSKRRRQGRGARHLQIYDIADRRPPRRSSWMGDTRVEWIRSFKDEALQLIQEHAMRIGEIRPRDAGALAKAKRILGCTEPQLRARARRLVKTDFGRPEPEPYEADDSEVERFTEKQALDVVASLPLETLQQVLISVECLNEPGLALALESMTWSDEVRDDWRSGWTWPGTVHRAVHLLEFRDKQAKVVSDLMLVMEESHTNPDFVVLEHEQLGRVRVLRRAIIYEAKTGGGKLSSNQENALLLCSKLEHVEYRVVHVIGEHIVPTTVAMHTYSSKDL
jgi:hypothetical protein